ncbi:hypothetical protein F2R06_14815 [Alistipes onderdonkii]|nr:hypothetical protein F2R06_14815 [Alistipes onderdonkii]
MERNIIIENICTACHCGERRAEEYLAVELRNLRELRDAGALCYGDLETACSGLGRIGNSTGVRSGSRLVLPCHTCRGQPEELFRGSKHRFPKK